MGFKEKVLNSAWRLSSWAQRHAGASLRHASPSDQLRTLLRKNPTWRLGHLELGEESLALDDIGTAYASAQVLVHLESNKPQSLFASKAHFLLGRCYLRRGDAKKALQLFTRKCTDPALTWKIKEECAAAYMVCGDTPSALSILLSIPEEQLSPEGAAAKAYLRKQQDGSLSSESYTSPPKRLH